MLQQYQPLEVEAWESRLGQAPLSCLHPFEDSTWKLEPNLKALAASLEQLLSCAFGKVVDEDGPFRAFVLCALLRSWHEI